MILWFQKYKNQLAQLPKEEPKLLKWNHFKKIIDDRRKSECKYCHQLFDHKEEYDICVLSKHYEKKHAKDYDLPPQILTDSSTLSTWRYKPEVNKHKLAEFII